MSLVDLFKWSENNIKHHFLLDLDPVSISKCRPALFHTGRTVGNGRRSLADPAQRLVVQRGISILACCLSADTVYQWSSLISSRAQRQKLLPHEPAWKHFLEKMPCHQLCRKLGRRVRHEQKYESSAASVWDIDPLLLSASDVDPLWLFVLCSDPFLYSASNIDPRSAELWTLIRFSIVAPEKIFWSNVVSVNLKYNLLLDRIVSRTRHLELPKVLSFFQLWCFLTLERIFSFYFAALYGVLFVTNQEASFANFRLWQSLGFVITFAYQSFICVSVKIYIMLAVLILGMALYYYVEVSTATYFILPLSISVEIKINSHCVKICDVINGFLFA